MHVSPARRLLALAAAALAFAAPRAARAQSHDGFLFGAPVGTLSVRAGFDHASAGGDLFQQTISDFTVSRGSFSGATVAADLAFNVGSRFAIVAGTGLSRSSASSHYRNFVDLDNNEIEQSTSFLRVPATVGVRAYLTPVGRSIGRYAWVPSRVSTYVGAGAGVMYYRFSQSGSFIVPSSGAVYDDVLSTSSWTPTAHALAGLDFALSDRLALTGEGRYTWARGDVGGDYEGFNRIDLSGLAATVGLSVRF